MNIDSTTLSRAFDTLVSLAAIGAAMSALQCQDNGDTARALIYAGGALAVALIPFNDMPRACYTLPLRELGARLAGRPVPLWRLATLCSWVLVIAGLVLAVFWN